MRQPLVSVLMTCYNREKFIGEAIESVLASVYPNFELIIVDDCSTDTTVDIAKHFEKLDSRIKVYVNECNLQQFPNRNKAAGYATGELLMSVDSDDTMKPDAIEYIVEQFENFPAAQFATIYGQEDIKVVTCMHPEENIRKHFFLSSHLHVGPGGTVIRHHHFKKIGGFPVCYGPAGDSYYNIKAAANGDTLLLPYFYYNYRLHGDQEIARKDSYLINNYMYFKDVVDLPELNLSGEERKYLLSREKKKFLVNLLIYYKETRDAKKIKEVWRKVGFGVKELIITIGQICHLVVTKKLASFFSFKKK
jgi:glycosyltransferase involved in cell wall biosynthesis